MNEICGFFRAFEELSKFRSDRGFDNILGIFDFDELLKFY